MEQISISKLFDRAENEYLTFINEVQKLEVLEYPTQSCETFLTELKNTAEQALKEIRSFNLADLKGTEKLAKDFLRTAHVFLVRRLSLFLDFVNGSQTQKVPWSFIPSVERLAKNIIPDFEPILYCNNEYNYGIYWDPQPSADLYKYCFISLPRLHRTNVLMHTLIGHELFHPKCEEFTKKHAKEVAVNIAAESKKVSGISSDDIFGQQKLAEINDTLFTAWKRAMHELLCDLACIKLFGPAALLAMESYSCFSDYNIPPSSTSNFYPPLQYRFEVVWKFGMDESFLAKLYDIILSDERIKDVSANFKNEVDSLSADLTSFKSLELISEDKLMKIAYDEVHKFIEPASRYVDENIPNNVTRWNSEKVLNQIPDLIFRLKNGIPPNEITKIKMSEKGEIWTYDPDPAELASILLAGCIYQAHKNVNRNDSEILKFDVLSRLLLKACEDAEMLKSN